MISLCWIGLSDREIIWPFSIPVTEAFENRELVTVGFNLFLSDDGLEQSAPSIKKKKKKMQLGNYVDSAEHIRFYFRKSDLPPDSSFWFGEKKKKK